MEFRQWLVEMPLSHYGWKYNVKEPFPNQANFERIHKVREPRQFFISDRKRILSVRNKFEEILNRTPFKWNVIFLESPPERIHQDALNYIEANNVQTQGHITFVKNSSSGEQFTPWILCHVISHSLDSDMFNPTKPVHKENMKSGSIVNDLIGALSKKFSELDLFPQRLYGVDHKILDFLIPYMPFKSARTSMQAMIKSGMNFAQSKGAIQSNSECVHELLAYYLFNSGKIKLQQIKEDHPIEDLPKTFRYPSDNDLRAIEKTIENVFTAELRAAVGHIIFDAF